MSRLSINAVKSTLPVVCLLSEPVDVFAPLASGFKFETLFCWGLGPVERMGCHGIAECSLLDCWPLSPDAVNLCSDCATEAPREWPALKRTVDVDLWFCCYDACEPQARFSCPDVDDKMVAWAWLPVLHPVG